MYGNDMIKMEMDCSNDELVIVDVNRVETVRRACVENGFFYFPYDYDDSLLIYIIINEAKLFFNQTEELKKQHPLHNGYGYAPLNRPKKEGKVKDYNEVLSLGGRNIRFIVINSTCMRKTYSALYSNH